VFTSPPEHRETRDKDNASSPVIVKRGSSPSLGATERNRFVLLKFALEFFLLIVLFSRPSKTTLSTTPPSAANLLKEKEAKDAKRGSMSGPKKDKEKEKDKEKDKDRERKSKVVVAKQ